MKKIIIFLFSLIFLIGCGTPEQDKEIEIDNLQEIDGKIYEYGEEKPYSGKIITKDENDKVVMVETAKDGKIEGEVETYYESGKLKEKYNLDTVLVTRSEEGMTLYDKEIHNIPTYAKEVYDVTGAGDTVISVFTLAKAAGATWEEAAKIANTAGGIVVGKIGTSTVSEKELIETYNSIYNTGDVCKC